MMALKLTKAGEDVPFCHLRLPKTNLLMGFAYGEKSYK